ncbi:hypothetical protein POVWA2_020040 [Plasmodium ovale wallikeri]|uniref:Uncharacterized protein n=1 Tax=Plasmodium ovale wallikeri TaxID=864142 RepID=A0A1A8YRD1_PLAOA|nr:hypothetical protein POVWA1_019850 [Plasmodium ovale wallikeri]SBT34504.1 hypothetical protein POVWA2_020040 [Plasmodium ovale wallikeri]
MSKKGASRRCIKKYQEGAAFISNVLTIEVVAKLEAGYACDHVCPCERSETSPNTLPKGEVRKMDRFKKKRHTFFSISLEKWETIIHGRTYQVSTSTKKRKKKKIQK